ncbi:hypothetical protein D3C78_1590070 [compost metagenome]
MNSAWLPSKSLHENTYAPKMHSDLKNKLESLQYLADSPIMESDGLISPKKLMGIVLQKYLKYIQCYVELLSNFYFSSCIMVIKFVSNYYLISRLDGFVLI